MTDNQKHTIALGWLKVRRASLLAGRAEIERQAQEFGMSDYWRGQLAEQDAKIANLDDSTDVLLTDGGYVDVAGAIDDGTVISGVVLDDSFDQDAVDLDTEWLPEDNVAESEPLVWNDNGDGTETATVILSATYYNEDDYANDAYRNDLSAQG